MVGSLLYWDSVQPDGSVVEPGPFRKLAVRMNQAMTEHGVAPPWVDPVKDVHEFWSESVNVEPDAGNKPGDYAVKPPVAPRFMDAFWSPFVTKDDSILELGCNAGPNLGGLWELETQVTKLVEKGPSRRRPRS